MAVVLEIKTGFQLGMNKYKLLTEEFPLSQEQECD